MRQTAIFRMTVHRERKTKEAGPCCEGVPTASLCGAAEGWLGGARRAPKRSTVEWFVVHLPSLIVAPRKSGLSTGPNSRQAAGAAAFEAMRADRPYVAAVDALYDRLEALLGEEGQARLALASHGRGLGSSTLGTPTSRSYACAASSCRPSGAPAPM